MDTFMPLLLLTLCACARSEPLPDAVQRRSDKHVYASDYTRQYEPMTYAAIPLHSPIPILHILSPVPPKDSRTAQSAKRPVYMLPPNPLFDQSRYGLPYRYAQPYASTENLYANQDAEDTAPTILYARPNPNGGYTYRRRPTKKRSPPKRPPSEPIIIRVHKYRVVRDR